MRLEELLRDLPDGQALYDDLRARVTKVLDDNIARADDQTRDTKDIFAIPEAIGVVVILNETATLLYPDQSTLRIFEVLRKLCGGELRYVHNHVVIYISEAHVVEAADGATMYDMATVYSDAGNATPFATTFAEDLNGGGPRLSGWVIWSRPNFGTTSGRVILSNPSTSCGHHPRTKSRLYRGIDLPATAPRL